MKCPDTHFVGDGDLLSTDGDLADMERDNLAGGSGEKEILFLDDEGVRRGLNVYPGST